MFVFEYVRVCLSLCVCICTDVCSTTLDVDDRSISIAFILVQEVYLQQSPGFMDQCLKIWISHIRIQFIFQEFVSDFIFFVVIVPRYTVQKSKQIPIFRHLALSHEKSMKILKFVKEIHPQLSNGYQAQGRVSKKMLVLKILLF